jgi:putative ABC transport system permease protein
LNRFLFAARSLRRDLRAGELTLLALAIAIAVGALAAVGLFSERMRVALGQEARQILGADLVLSSDRMPAAELDAHAREAGLTFTRTVVFPSMVGSGDALRLGSIKAVGPGYPLRGQVLLSQASAESVAATDIPAPGSVWLDDALMATLAVKPGDTVTLGASKFRVEAGIAFEPDRGASFVNFSPRVMLRLDELEATGLVQPASRVTWRLLVAGDSRAVDRFQSALTKDGLPRGQRIETLQAGRPELRTTLDRAEQFLALVALLTALLSAVAIGLGAQRFAQRHVDGIAVMKALGATQGDLVMVTLIELALLGLGAGVFGVLAGWTAQAVLVGLAAPMLKTSLPPPTWIPALQALAAGMVLLLGTAMVPLRALAGVPPLRVLRRDLPAPSAGTWQTAIATFLTFAALVVWAVRDVKLALLGLGGFVAGTLVFVLAAAMAVRSSGWLRSVIGLAGGDRAVLRVALASWSRRKGASIAQTAALAVALMALVLLTVTRDDLLSSWRKASPADAPNRFLINIQPEQRDAVRELLEAAMKSAGLPSPELFPMVRARLVAIDAKSIVPETLGDRARSMVDREINISYAENAPAYNEMIEGRDVAKGAAELTAEEGLAKVLGLKLGSRLTFDVAGEPLELTLVGIRKLAWDSMRVNFFLMASPGAMLDRPQSWITAFREPSLEPKVEPKFEPNSGGAVRSDAMSRAPGAGASSVADSLVRRFPNLTVFDTDNLIRQVQSILDRVSAAVEFLFAFTLAAGLVVLAAALAGSQDERTRESAILRALGASRSQLVRAQAVELMLGGAASGLLASLGAVLLAWLLAHSVFDFPFVPRWWTIPATMAAGGLGSLIVGWIGLRKVLASPPIEALRG